MPTLRGTPRLRFAVSALNAMPAFFHFICRTLCLRCQENTRDSPHIATTEEPLLRAHRYPSHYLHIFSEDLMNGAFHGLCFFRSRTRD
jgi:hypothetical protein